MSKFITDDIGKVVDRVRLLTNDNGKPYYMFGHRIEVKDRLNAMDKQSVAKYQKYPLIVLNMDIKELERDGTTQYLLNVIILDRTEKNYVAPERMDNVVKPILYPLYEKFIESLNKVGIFYWEGNKARPDHDRIIRLYWGTAGEEGNAANLFSDPLDAIEIQNLKIFQVIKKC